MDKQERQAMKIDHHVHSDSDDPGIIKAFIEVLEKNETMACVSGGGWRGDHSYPGNDNSLAIAKAYPDLVIPFAWINLWNESDRAAGASEQVDRFVERGFRGFKFIAPWYEYDHDLYMPIYERIAEYRLPVLFHTGHYRPSPSQATADFRRPLIRNMRPLTLDRIARSFPDLPVIMAHMGTSLYWEEGAQLCLGTPNIYADLAGCGNWGRMTPERLQELLVSPYCYGVSNALNKLLLGSDAYVTRPKIVEDAQKYYARLLPEKYRADAFGGTMAKMLKM
ncbi:MAG: amidohydrolase family protein [Lentisphaeria bacterium]